MIVAAILALIAFALISTMFTGILGIAATPTPPNRDETRRRLNEANELDQTHTGRDRMPL